MDLTEVHRSVLHQGLENFHTLAQRKERAGSADVSVNIALAESRITTYHNKFAASRKGILALHMCDNPGPSLGPSLDLLRQRGHGLTLLGETPLEEYLGTARKPWPGKT